MNVEPTWPRVHRWPVTLDDGPLRLRPLRRRDARAWASVRGRNANWLRRWDPTSPTEDPADALSFPALVRAFSKQARDFQSIPWAIDLEVAGRRRLIGQLVINGITLGSARFAQIGYWIDEEFAGRGITPWCVAWAADYCLQVLRLHRLEICIRPENEASLRVVAKLGLPEEGLRRAYLHIDHEWRDHRVFVIVADEAADGLRSRVSRPRLSGLASENRS